MLKYTSLIPIAVALLSGCASVPDVTYTYYLGKSQTTASVTQTVTCNNSNAVIGYGAPTVTTAYVADYNRPEKISLHDLNSNFADNSFSLSLTSDGRLQSSNATWTGQGQTILQSAISLGTTALAIAGHAPEKNLLPKKKKAKPLTACDIVTKNAPDGKTVSFVYSDITDPVDLGAASLKGKFFPLALPTGSDSEKLLKALQDADLTIPTTFTLNVDDQFLPKDLPIAVNATAPIYPGHITVQKIARVPYEVEVNGVTLAVGNVLVPRTDGVSDTYDVPLTGATFFGTQSYQLTLATDGTGAMTTSTYGDNAGTSTSNVINVINSGLTPLKPPSP